MFCIHPSPFIKSLKGFRLSGEVRGETERAILYREMIELVRRRERDFSWSPSQLLFVFLLDQIRAGRRMTNNISDCSDDTVYLKVSQYHLYFQPRALHFFMKGLRWFMFWPWLPSKSTRALWCHFPRWKGEGTSLCREGNPGSKEGIREKEQTIFTINYLFLYPTKTQKLIFSPFF